VGTRYVAVIVRGATEPVTFRAPRLREISYPGHAKGRLKTGDALLDEVWDVGYTTLRRNMTDAYTDCPWREQAQWWGDARVEFLINAYTLGDTALLARGIRQCAQSMLSDGLMHGVFPGRGPLLPDYNFVWVETLWDHYWHTGSDALLRRHADDLRRNLAWFREQTDSSGLLPPPDGKWLFLDWANLNRGRYSTVYNLRYVQALSTAARIFNQLGDSLDADACLGRGMLTALALTQHVFDPETGLWHDGYDPERGERLEAVSVHAQALAILLGLDRTPMPISAVRCWSRRCCRSATTWSSHRRSSAPSCCRRCSPRASWRKCWPSSAGAGARGCRPGTRPGPRSGIRSGSTTSACATPGAVRRPTC